MKELNRKEIDNKYKWDLTTIYKDVSKWEKDYNKLSKEIDSILIFKNKLMESSSTLYEALKLLNDQVRILNNLSLYASLKLSENGNDSTALELTKKMEVLHYKLSINVSFIDPEILQSANLIDEYLKENEDLSIYTRYFYNLVRQNERVLDVEKEELIANVTKTIGTPSIIFDNLVDTEITFDPVIINDVEHELTVSSYSKYIKHGDRLVRRQAFINLHNGFKKHNKTLSLLYKTSIEEDNVFAKLRKYNSSFEMVSDNDEVDPSIFYTLVAVINQNMDIFTNYLKYKFNYLNIKDANMYDRHINIIENLDKKYSVGDAKDLVTNSLKILGDDYIEVINKAFSDKWIDYLPNKGKTSGAFSSGTYDTNKFILMNYNEKLDDVFTLTHELGHSVHSYYTSKEQPYPTSSYTIFVAEVASQVNEILLTEYLLKNSEDNLEKKYIIGNLLDKYISTMHRQTMFAEFEMIMHQAEWEDHPLTNEFMNDTYLNLNKRYFNDSINVNEEIKYEWSRIPHFYRAFYVYNYATSFAASIHIALNILKREENALDNYLRFLTLGDSIDPVNSLKVAGVDLTDISSYDEMINYFNEKFDQFKNL